MATTVNSAFEEFMQDTVNLDSDTTKEARKSRDNLLSNISEFDDKDGFLDYCCQGYLKYCEYFFLAEKAFGH
jgi:hypothetical protein